MKKRGNTEKTPIISTGLYTGISRHFKMPGFFQRISILFILLLFLSPSIPFMHTSVYPEPADQNLQDDNGNSYPAEENNETDSDEDSLLDTGGFLRESILGSESSLHPSYRPERYPISSRTTLGFGSIYEQGKLKMEIQARGDFIFSNYTDSFLFDAAWDKRLRNRLFYLEENKRTDSYLHSIYVHRLYASYNSQNYKITAGRQAISWGQGRFLNPLDLITPVGPFVMDLEDIPGADAVDYTYYFNAMNMLEGVVVPYRRYDDPNLKHMQGPDTNALMRFKATLGNLDYFFVAGYHFHSWVWGIDVNYTVFGASFRFAYLGRSEKNLSDYPYYYSDDLPPSVSHQAVIGASYTFFKKLRSNFEIFANSAYYANDSALSENMREDAFVSTGFLPPPENDAAYFRTAGRIITKNPVLIELSLSFDATDLLNLSCIFIEDPVGKSAMIGPFLSYSLSDESVLSLGGWLFSLPSDRQKAEFGEAEPAAYAYLRWHF